MSFRYKISYDLAGLGDTTMKGSLVRNSEVLEDPVDLKEVLPGIYEEDSQIAWLEGDDIIFYQDTVIKGSYTYQPEYKNRWNSK